MMKKYLLATTALVLVVSTASAQTEERTVVATGTCGSSCNYIMYEGGHVEVTGSGTAWSLKGVNQADITSISFNEGITAIGNNTYSQASLLTDVKFPDSLKSIGSDAFYGTSISQVNLPPNVETIGGYAFMTKTGIQNFNVQGDSLQIAWNVFSAGSTVGNLTLAGNLTWSCGTDCTATMDKDGHVDYSGTGAMGGIPYGIKSAVKSATIGEGITEINGGAFSGSGLLHVDLPDSLKSIGSDAFWDTNLTNVILPPNVETIGGYNFRSSTSSVNIFYSSEEQKKRLKAQNVNIKDSALTPYIINDDGTVYYTDDEGYDVRFGTYNTFKKGEVLEKYKKGADGRTYVYSADNQLRGAFQKNSDGSTYIYDENGKLKEIRGKKIYTVEEAMAVTRDGNVNRVRLTYK